MSLTAQRHSIVEKLVSFTDWVSQGQWHIESSQSADTFHSEIYQLEKTLANAPTRPIRVIRNSKPLEPVTEQQKIMDLAG
ncbi:MAG: hypothetical protein HC875_26070 [Anaerolineales bacterium]|nr:hypothetical protein [Anaerolineales bacterium]